MRFSFDVQLSGGFGQQGVMGDLWVLELHSLRWTPLAQTAGTQGVPKRSGHVAVAHTGTRRMDRKWTVRHRGVELDVWGRQA